MLKTNSKLYPIAGSHYEPRISKLHLIFEHLLPYKIILCRCFARIIRFPRLLSPKDLLSFPILADIVLSYIHFPSDQRFICLFCLRLLLKLSHRLIGSKGPVRKQPCIPRCSAVFSNHCHSLLGSATLTSSDSYSEHGDSDGGEPTTSAETGRRSNRN